MAIGLLGKKLGMTHIFDESGARVPVTAVEVSPSKIVDKKTVEKNGYAALVLGYGEKSKKNINKAQTVDFEKKKIAVKRYCREIRFEHTDDLKIGGEVTSRMFEVGDLVDVQGISKGKGFAGGMKRWGWAGGPASHGSKFKRGLGGTQAGPRLKRITKGKHMPGHMGSDTTTVQNLKIVAIEEDGNVLLIKGAVPGSSNSYVKVFLGIKQSYDTQERLAKLFEKTEENTTEEKPESKKPAAIEKTDQPAKETQKPAPAAEETKKTQAPAKETKEPAPAADEAKKTQDTAKEVKKPAPAAKPEAKPDAKGSEETK